MINQATDKIVAQDIEQYLDKEYPNHGRLRESIRKNLNDICNNNLMVYYGVGRIGNIRKKRTIEVWYANSAIYDRQLKILNGSMHVCYKRKQTKLEKVSAIGENRVFTSYEFDIDSKKYKRSLDYAISINTKVCENHVSNTEAKKIESALKAMFYSVHPSYAEPVIQLSLFD